MTRMRFRFAVAAALVAGLLLPVTASTPDKGTLATQIAEGRKQNQMMMRDYSWNTRTEVKIDGEVKSVKVDMMRFTADGELQRTKISDSADGQKKPRGIKGKVASKKIKGMQEWAQDLKVGNNISLSVNADSREHADHLFSKLSEGGKVTMPMDNTFWGSYFGMCTDRFDINWMIDFGEEPEG